jgi:hypothetical protein
MPLKEKLIKHYNTNTESGCWEWTGYRDRDGYGRTEVIHPRTHKRHTLQAHRASYEVFVGRIPKGKVIAHKCDNPQCINPEHLFVATPAENIQDMLNKGRINYGKNARAKLRAEDITAIRVSKLTQAELGIIYGVSQVQISRVKLRKDWKHIT